MPVTIRSRASSVAAPLLACAAACAAAAPLAAQSAPARVPPAEQIAAAVLPLPAELRDAATVLGYDAAGKLVTLREGNGAMNGSSER
jgi:hypothetical protein